MKNFTQLLPGRDGSNAKNDNTLGRMRGGIRSRIGSMSLKNTSLFGVILALLLTFGVGQMRGANITSDGNAILFFKMDAVAWWTAGTNGDGNFAYFYGTSGNAWSAHSVQQTDKYYYVKIPSGTWDHVILTRNNTSTSPSWDNKWNKTGDIALESGKNYISAFSENNATATFSTYQLTSTASLSGTASITTAQTSTLTPSLSSNTTYNEIKSTAYSVTTNPGSAGSVTSGGVFSATAAGTYTVTATVTYNAKGYTGITKTATATKSITVSAPASNTLTVNTDGHGTITTPSGGSTSYTIGSPVSISATSNTGYTFKNWTTTSGTVTFANASSASTTVTVTAGTTATIQANFTENMRTITLTADPSGTGTFTVGGAAATSTTAGISTSRTVAAVANPGYAFVSWTATNCSVASTTSSSTTLSGDGSTGSGTLVATFVPQWNIKGSGTEMGGWETFNTLNYVSGTTYRGTITLAANTTYEFKVVDRENNNWYGNASAFVGQSGFLTISTSVDNNCHIATAGAGTYTFEFNSDTKALTVSYPDVHPSANFLYAKDNSWTGPAKAYTYNDEIASWSNQPNADSFEFDGATYYFAAAGGNANIIISDNGDGTKRIETTSSDHLGKYYDFSSSSFKDFKVLITLDNEGATSAGTESVNPVYTSGHTDALSSITVPTKTGYTFGGYYTERNGAGSQLINASGVWQTVATYTNGSKQWIKPASVTLYAKWTVKTTTITLNLNGGTSGATSVTATYDAELPSFTLATKTGGYNLTGYWTASSGGTKVINADGTFAANDGNWNYTDASTLTLYAQWSNFLTVTYDGNGNTGGTAPTDATEYSSGATVTVKAKPDGLVKTGYTFTGWKTGGTTYTAGQTFSITANTTMVAQWSENLTTVTINVNPSGAGTLTLDASAFTAGNTTTAGVTTSHTVTTTTNTGYIFNNWTTTGNATGSASTNTYTLNGNGSAGTGTLTANFTAKTLVRLYFSNPNSWGTVKAYVYDYDGVEASNASWPGEDASAVLIDCNEYYYYEYYKEDHPGWDVIIFNNGSGGDGNQTADLAYSNTTNNGQYTNGTAADWYASPTARWSLFGSWDSWDAGSTLTCADAASGYVELTLDANTDYEFKFVDNTASAWYGATTVTRITYSNKATAQTMNSTSGSNQTITTAGAGTYRFDWNITSKQVTVTYPTSYTVTYGIGTGGTSVSATVGGNALASGKYVTAGSDVTFTQTPATGYTFNGWYTAASGGSAVATMGVSDNVLNSISANATVYAQYTPNNYTVTFDATTNGGTCATASKSVTFDAAYGDLPEATKDAKVFAGWYTTASGAGTQVTAETIVSTADDHTLYARFEDTYSVTIQYKSGDVTLKPNGSTTASATALAPEISAPEILGYTFTGWTGTSATFADASSATTTVNVTAATTITANYSAIPTVYFKNNLGWDHVYVTFDNGWSSAAPTNNGKPYFEMTQMGESDIFYCAIPSTYTASNYASWAWNIAFDNHGFEASENVGSHSGGFNTGEFVGRGDFDPKATMFIPYYNDTEARNGGTYYKTGCWMKYNSTESGYQVKVNKWVTGANADTLTVNLTADIAGGYEFSAIVNLKSANYGYGIKLYKDYQKNTNDIYYSNKGSIHSNTTTLPWEFATKIDEEDVTADTRRCELYTESLGGYKITVSFATGKPMVDVEYPVSTGDWKLIYKDRATWSNGAHSASWCHPSRVIKAKANAEDIVSFYVAYGSTPSVELHKCTAINALTGAETWVKQSDVTISSITKTGIYNFKVSQDAEKAATVTVDGGYDGNFYIRTDASDGGWANYKTSGTNTMTYSEYAEEKSGFTHYFMRYVNTGTNIKFCIANDYSECISDTLIGDSFTGEYIAVYGNVRFMWDHRTNKVSRAYISGSSNVSDRFLVLEGDNKMFNESGTALTTAAGGKVEDLNEYEMNFTDDQNWIYEATVQAQPGARIKLTAKYNNKIQYFYGAEGDRGEETTELLLGGDEESENKYKIRLVYDFKTNRLIKAFIPSGTITEDLSIEADLMIIREHQEDAQQINFTGDGALSDVKTVYGAMKFNKYTVNGKEKTGGHALTGDSPYKRDLFYISFPFDVKLSDVFGFGTYGKHWIIEYYDGKGRAKNGFWADSDSYWKFVLPSQRSSFTLKAFEGYILALDLDEMTEGASIWNNGVEDVYVYFPSSAAVEDIQATNRLVTIDQEGYQCQIGPRFEGGDDRRLKDSYWHVIGVPSFANYNSTLTETNGGTAIDWSDDNGEIDWETPSLPYLYEWNSTDNSLTVTTSATFNFKATYSYMVQYAGTSIYWSAVNATPSSVVARKNDNQPTSAEFRLELQQTGKAIDQTFVRLTDEVNVTTGFDFNYDLSKEMNANKANIFTMITTAMDDGNTVTESAANCLPMSGQTTVVPVGVKIAANDDYTFSIPDGANGVGVTLIDNLTGTRTNLSAVDYTVSLETGTYDERFTLEISPIQYLPTELEQSDINNQMSDVRKVLIDGLLYIVHDNKMYDARGARVE